MLEEMKRAADERDYLVRRIREMERDVARLKRDDDEESGILIQRTTRLESMLHKVEDYERVSRIVEEQRKTIEKLRTILNERMAAIESFPEQIKQLTEEVARLTKRKKTLIQTNADLRFQIDESLLGKFEYYEVKREGETLASIAALPTVYNNETRAIWLEQANRHRDVKLDDLSPKDLLIVPRFDISGNYVW